MGNSGNSNSNSNGSNRKTDAAAATTDASPIFVDVTSEVGIDFVHDNGATGSYHMAEISGSGIALVDYDNDDDLDLYLVQSGPLPGAATDPGRSRDRLYRNQLSAGRGLFFEDVSASSGDLGGGYGMSAAVGDFDGDGWADIYVTSLGPNELLRNNHDGTFTEVAEGVGVAEERWSIPAVFFDFDADGWQDLYVGNYLQIGNQPPACVDLTGAPDYCGPELFAPIADRLFRNRGDGTYQDITSATGLKGGGPALGALAADLDGDGSLDLYVANDGAANSLWQLTDGRLEDRALLAGCSLNRQGRAEASMGVDASDFDGDGDLDLFMTHLISETNTLYRNDGRGGFDDVTVAMRLAAPSVLRTSFGAGWLDFDSDGWQDLLVVNGGVNP